MSAEPAGGPLNRNCVELKADGRQHLRDAGVQFAAQPLALHFELSDDVTAAPAAAPMSPPVETLLDAEQMQHV